MHRAIETRYSGYRFRSRLEARWAVFFDTLGLHWEYEPEGFELGEGRRYLPDFFIRCEPGWCGAKRHPGAGYWVEVKPTEPNERERALLLDVVKFTKHHGNFVYGPPGENAPISIREPRNPPPSRDEQEAMAILTARMPAWAPPFALWASDFVGATIQASPSPDDVLKACAAARSARFEFGEQGRMSA